MLSDISSSTQGPLGDVEENPTADFTDAWFQPQQRPLPSIFHMSWNVLVSIHHQGLFHSPLLVSTTPHSAFSRPVDDLLSCNIRKNRLQGSCSTSYPFPCPHLHSVPHVFNFILFLEYLQSFPFH